MENKELTVRELIELLQEADPDKKVVLKVRGNSSRDYGINQETWTEEKDYTFWIINE